MHELVDEHQEVCGRALAAVDLRAERGELRAGVVLAQERSELLREFNEFTSTNPATPEELERSVNNNTRSLPGQFETASSVRNSLVSSHNLGRDWNYPATLTERYRALDLDEVRAAAQEVVHPEQLVWLIIGDAAEIEAGIRELDMGEVEVRRMGQ